MRDTRDGRHLFDAIDRAVAHRRHLSSIVFIAYAAIMGVWPMLLTEVVVLPINCWRLYEVLRTGAAAPGEWRQSPVAAGLVR